MGDLILKNRKAILIWKSLTGKALSTALKITGHQEKTGLTGI